MRPTRHAPRPKRIRSGRLPFPREWPPQASAVLGVDHPLVRVSAALAVVGRQSLAVAAVLAASATSAVAGAAWATVMALSAGGVLVALGAVAGLLQQRKRECSLDLILEGRERVPVAAVERERGRLLNPALRSCLAASFESLVDEALTPSKLPPSYLFQRGVVAAVADELREVSALLRVEPESARGVALARSLLTNGVLSPLHRGDVAALEQELGRIRYLLTSCCSADCCSRASP